MTMCELETDFKYDYKRELRLRAEGPLDVQAHKDDDVTVAKPFSVFLVFLNSLGLKPSLALLVSEVLMAYHPADSRKFYPAL